MGVASAGRRFHMHAGDSCWHCYRLHNPQQPIRYIIGVKPARSQATSRGRRALRGQLMTVAACVLFVRVMLHWRLRLRR